MHESKICKPIRFIISLNGPQCVFSSLPCWDLSSALILNWPAHCKTLAVYFPVFILQGACAAILVSCIQWERDLCIQAKTRGRVFSPAWPQRFPENIPAADWRGDTTTNLCVHFFYFCLSPRVIIWPWEEVTHSLYGLAEGGGRKKKSFWWTVIMAEKQLVTKQSYFLMDV